MIGTTLKWLGGITLCLVLQTTVMRTISIAGIAPDLLLLVLFLLGIRTSVMPCIYAGFLTGLCQDLYSPAILGQHALAMTVTGAFTGLFNEKVMRTDPVMKLIILLVAFFIHDAIFTIVTIVQIDASWTLFFRNLFASTIPRAIYSIALVSLIYIVRHQLKPSPKH